MFSLDGGVKYWLYNKPVDMRKSFNGLSGIVSTGLLYSQYFTPPSRLNIARRYYLPQMRCGHISLDAHRGTA